jgi:nicotinate-nucleotide adenylyltransferase
VSAPTRRIGLFGGTFDPPHVGHLVAAERFLTHLHLDRVLWMPCQQPVLKDRPTASADDRLAMVCLAVAGRAAFEVSDLELRRPGPTYTVDTLESLAGYEPDVEWWLLLGLDALADFPRWRNPHRIVELARLAVVERPGAESEAVLRGLPAELAARVEGVPMPLLAIASRDLRADVAAGRSVRYLVPDAVAAHIAKQRLYARA